MNYFFAGSTFQFGTRRISTTWFDSSVAYLFEKDLSCLSGSLSVRVCLFNENGAVGAKVSKFTLKNITKSKNSVKMTRHETFLQ